MAMQYRAPWWLPGGHLQTIWASVRSRRIEAAPPPLERQRWSTPDGDFVDVDWLTGPCDGGGSLYTSDAADDLSGRSLPITRGLDYPK